MRGSTWEYFIQVTKMQLLFNNKTNGEEKAEKSVAIEENYNAETKKRR